MYTIWLPLPPPASSNCSTNTLPFFAEALPFFLISVAIESVVAALVARRKRLYRTNDAGACVRVCVRACAKVVRAIGLG